MMDRRDVCRAFAWAVAGAGLALATPQVACAQPAPAKSRPNIVVYWETRKTPSGGVNAPFSRPGKQYTLHIAPDGKSVTVDEKRQGFLGIMHFLHGGMRVPGSAFVSSWGWYTRFCSLAVLFAAVTGVYLFASRPSGRRGASIAGWLSLAVAGVISLAFIIWMATLA